MLKRLKSAFIVPATIYQVEDVTFIVANTLYLLYLHTNPNYTPPHRMLYIASS